MNHPPTTAVASATSQLLTMLKQRAKLLLVLFALSWMMSAPGTSFAQTVPTKGTLIGNQATATYKDASGQTQTVDSNTVQTVVAQVAAVDLTQDQTKVGTPGQQVYFSHTITNLGNGNDTFTLTVGTPSNTNVLSSGLLIYPDVNKDGRPDVGASPITVTPSLAPGEQYSVVVVGNIPAGAPLNGSSTVTVTATSTTDTTKSDTNTDTVTVTAGANIELTKSVSATSGAPGASTQYTYTLTYINRGNADAGATTITDVIPSGLQYVAGSGVWSVGNTTLTDASGDTQPVGGDTIDYEYSNGTVTADLNRVQRGITYTLSFKFTVPAGTSAGVRNNTATVTYDGNTTPSNTVPFTVTGNAGVTGKGEYSNIAAPPSGTPIPQGAQFDFVNSFTNTGTATDTFNLTVPASTFPAGTSFQLLRGTSASGPTSPNLLVSGASPFTDSNNDGIIDTGPLAPGATVYVVVRVQLPGNATGGGPYTVTKRATSVNDPSKSADVTDTLATITAATVDLLNRNATNTGSGATGTTIVNTYNAQPGSTVTIDLAVKNTSTQSSSYNLSYTTVAALPAGATITFVDSNGAPITSTPAIAAGGTYNYSARIVIPANASAGNIDVDFKATSGSTGASDVKRDRIVIGNRRGLVLEPNNSSQTFAGSTVVYSHTLTNTGNTAETVTVTATESQPGFTSVVYIDVNNNGVIDAGDTLLTGSTVTLDPGASVKLLVRVAAPANAAPGTINTTTLTATGTAGAIGGVATPSDTATDTTTIVAGQLKLDKTQALDANADGTADTAYGQANISVKPGQGIRYKITVTNIGSAPVNTVVVTDNTPPYTTYEVGDDSLDDSGKAVIQLPDGTYQAATSAPADGGTGVLTFQLANPLLPGQVATVYFGVRVNG